MSRKFLRLIFNVDKEERIHTTLLIVFVPSNYLMLKILYLIMSRRPLFDRADHLRVFRVGPEQITGLFIQAYFTMTRTFSEPDLLRVLVDLFESLGHLDPLNLLQIFLLRERPASSTVSKLG